MDPKYKLYADVTGAFVSANADLKPAVAYKLAQQDWTNIKKNIELCIQTCHAKIIYKYCSLWLHKQYLLKVKF